MAVEASKQVEPQKPIGVSDLDRYYQRVLITGLRRHVLLADIFLITDGVNAGAGRLHASKLYLMERLQKIPFSFHERKN